MEIGTRVYKYELSNSIVKSNACYSGRIVGVLKEIFIDGFTNKTKELVRQYNIKTDNDIMIYTSDVNSFDVNKEVAIKKAISNAKMKVKEYEEEIKTLKISIKNAEKDLATLKKEK